MFNIKDLSSKSLNRIKLYKYDSIIEKHEGPMHWESILEYGSPDFLEIDNKSILLPLESKHLQNITVLRTIIDKDERVITIFLKDTTYVERPEEEFFSGFLAICERVPNEEFYIAILYHEWFIIEEHIRSIELKT